MNRLLNQFRYSFERDVIEYFAVITIGSAGACTLTRGKGVASVTLNSTGNYSILLQDKSARFLGISEMILSGSSPAAAPICALVSETVSSTKIVRIQQYAIDNSTATNPASGEILYIKIAVCNN